MRPTSKHLLIRFHLHWVLHPHVIWYNLTSSRLPLVQTWPGKGDIQSRKYIIRNGRINRVGYGMSWWIYLFGELDQNQIVFTLNAMLVRITFWFWMLLKLCLHRQLNKDKNLVEIYKFPSFSIKPREEWKMEKGCVAFPSLSFYSP